MRKNLIALLSVMLAAGAAYPGVRCVGAGCGGGSAVTNAYTAAGSYPWAKPASATWVTVVCYGGGGGGGGGQGNAAGNVRQGGTGGGGGARVERTFAASDLTSTVTVTVGAAGVGGLGGSTAVGSNPATP